MQSEGVGKPMYILTFFKLEANVDTLTTFFELDHYLLRLITSSSEKIEILGRSGLNETSLFDD